MQTSAPLTWTAYEYIDHSKPASWNVLWALSAVGIAFVIWLITRDLFPSITVAIGVALLGVYGRRKPQQLSCTLDDHGITIGHQYHPYSDFRSFSVIPEGAFISIEFTPLKRFAFYANIYLDPADEEKIISRLSIHLPMDEARQSLTDNFMRRIHF